MDGGGRPGHPGDYTAEELRERSTAVRALMAEMKTAGVFVLLGGLDPAAPVFRVDASSGTPLFTDGPFVESKEWNARGPQASSLSHISWRRCVAHLLSDHMSATSLTIGPCRSCAESSPTGVG